MGLFICSKCECVENTALGWYWSCHYEPSIIILPDELKQYEGEPLCSECLPVVDYSDYSGKTGTGKWHKKFPKQYYKEFLKENPEYKQYGNKLECNQ